MLLTILRLEDPRHPELMQLKHDPMQPKQVDPTSSVHRASNHWLIEQPAE